jgi:hypothetical protein
MVVEGKGDREGAEMEGTELTVRKWEMAEEGENGKAGNDLGQ